MIIDIETLMSWGAVEKEYSKNETIFNEGDPALFYFQIVKGNVKMYNSTEDGKEFTQGYFVDGQSFGEPPLFIDEKYPSTAVACSNSKIIKLSKDKFLNLLEENGIILKTFLVLMAHRIYSKAMTSKDIINQKPEYRILAFLKANKKNAYNKKKELVPFTRQEIANFTGLRIETVIRAILKMKSSKIIDIINHKIYY